MRGYVVYLFELYSAYPRMFSKWLGRVYRIHYDLGVATDRLGLDLHWRYRCKLPLSSPFLFPTYWSTFTTGSQSSAVSARLPVSPPPLSLSLSSLLDVRSARCCRLETARKREREKEKEKVQFMIEMGFNEPNNHKCFWLKLISNIICFDIAAKVYCTTMWEIAVY